MMALSMPLMAVEVSPAVPLIGNPLRGICRFLRYH